MSLNLNQAYADYLRAWQQQNPSLIPKVEGEQQIYLYWLYYQLFVIEQHLPLDSLYCPVTEIRKRL